MLCCVYKPMQPITKCSFCFVLILALLPCVASAADHRVLACVGGTVYPSPIAKPIKDAVLVIDNGKITNLSNQSNTTYDLPLSAIRLDCKGRFIVAGFWNNHAHFETGWQNAAEQPAEKLKSRMQDMLTRWGVTAVWDLGSKVNNTLPLRRRVDSGEVPGPQILMAGDIFPKNGHPAYLPAEMQTPEAGTPHEAEQMTEQYMKIGFDGLKLFTGSSMGAKPVVNMDTFWRH